MKFRPAPIPTLFVVAALCVLAALGVWQLRRNTETNQLLQEIDSKIDGEPARDEGLGGDPAALQWRSAELSGTWDPVRPALITGRYEGGIPGYDLVAVLRVPAPTGEVALLVNRGWVPADAAQAFQDGKATPPGPARVHGLLLVAGGDPDAKPIPASATAPERWFATTGMSGCVARDKAGPPYRAIAKALGHPEIGLVLVEGDAVENAAQKNRDVLPITGFMPRPDTRPHLEYAATWFSIGGVLILLWLYAGFRRGRG